VFGRKSRRRQTPQGEISYEKAATPEPQVSA
jgi:hypothetical protein